MSHGTGALENTKHHWAGSSGRLHTPIESIENVWTTAHKNSRLVRGELEDLWPCRVKVGRGYVHCIEYANVGSLLAVKNYYYFIST